MARPSRRVARRISLRAWAPGVVSFQGRPLRPRGDRGLGLTSGDGGVTRPGVAGAIGRDEADRLLRRDLREQLGPHGAVADPAPP